MKLLLSVVLALGIVLLALSPCFAENCLHKLGRGLINGATGWCEYPTQIGETSKEQNVAVGLTWGQIKGIGLGIARTGIGVYDTATFLVPPYDKVLLEPKYVFEF